MESLKVFACSSRVEWLVAGGSGQKSYWGFLEQHHFTLASYFIQISSARDVTAPNSVP